MTARYWFRPKQYGYGATPTTWEGWVVTLLGAAISVGIVYVLTGGYRPLSATETVVCWIAFVVVVVGIMVVARAKTEGGWQWRWGGSK